MIRIGVVLGGLLMGLILLWERNTLIQLGLEIRERESEKTTLLQEHHQLLIEIASLSSYRRIEQIATSQMGMIRPDAHQVVMVLEGQSVDEAKPDPTRHALKRFADRGVSGSSNEIGVPRSEAGDVGFSQAGIFPLKRAR